jgi:hypothetical protein
LATAGIDDNCTHSYVGVLKNFGFSYFLFSYLQHNQKIFLVGLKNLEQGSHKCVQLRGEYVEQIHFFNPVAYCFLYKVKHLSAQIVYKKLVRKIFG